MKRITTTIKREWLDRILARTKKIEYREIKPYWTERLTQPGGTTIPVPFELRLINGMKKRAPEATLLINKITVSDTDFELHIAKILSTKNI
jgi:hypothetical protein